MEARRVVRRGERNASLSERVCVIVNPAAGRRHGARLLPEVRSAFSAKGVTDIFVTSESHEEDKFAREAIANGYSTIVCVGGDGTCSNVANTILRASSDIRLGVVPAGTGNDFARTVGLERAAPAMIAELAVKSTNTRMDVGRIEDNFFLNSCGFGFDVAVLQGLARARWIGNNVVYFYSALQQIMGFAGIELSVRSPAMTRESEMHLLVVIANGARFGGGLVIAPTATVTDGLLDAVMIRDATRTRRLQMLVAATRGTHARFGEVVIERAERFTLRFAKTPSFESDGELHQARSEELSVECIPNALRVVASSRFGAH
jgi:diacylglycerol kinase (ATP)